MWFVCSSRSTWGSAQGRSEMAFLRYFSQLKTQHHQVTMLGNGKYRKPVGKFRSFCLLVTVVSWRDAVSRDNSVLWNSLWIVWLHPNSLERKKHCQNLSNLTLFPPTTQRYQLFKRLCSSSSLPLGDRDRGDCNDRGVSKDGVFALAAFQAHAKTIS